MKTNKGSRSAGQYRSVRMARRRSRVMQVARELIAESGFDGFSMWQLARRAQVAEATLYNIHGSREKLLAAALTEQLEYGLRQRDAEQRYTIDALMRHLEERARVALQDPEYARAAFAQYFSMSADNPVRTRLQYFTLTNLEATLQHVQLAEELVGHVRPALVAESIAGHLYLTYHGWSIGRIPSEALAARLKYGTLLGLAAVTTGASATAVATELRGADAELARCEAEAPQANAGVLG